MRRIIVLLFCFLLIGCVPNKEVDELKKQVEANQKTIEELTNQLETERAERIAEESKSASLESTSRIKNKELEELLQLFLTTSKQYYDRDLTSEEFRNKMDAISSRGSSLLKKIEDEDSTEHLVCFLVVYYSNLFDSSVMISGYDGFLKNYEKFLEEFKGNES